MAKNIYENHGQLWLTARLLQQTGQFRMPEDARKLIEAVYGDEALDTISEGLQESAWDADGTYKAETSIARLNQLNLETGYTDTTANRWWDEVKTPTRLGEETITLYLAKWDKNQLSPWRDESHYAWAYSSVSVRTYWVAEEMHPVDIPQDQIDSCKEKLPAKGQWGVLVVLAKTVNGQWEGQALNEKGDKVAITYNKISGLEVQL